MKSQTSAYTQHFCPTPNGPGETRRADAAELWRAEGCDTPPCHHDTDAGTLACPTIKRTRPGVHEQSEICREGLGVT